MNFKINLFNVLHNSEFTGSLHIAHIHLMLDFKGKLYVSYLDSRHITMSGIPWCDHIAFKYNLDG